MTKLNNDQIDFCNCQDDNIKLLAPAGSGKTYSILWRCKTISEKSKKKEKFLIFTFTQVAKDELLDRINNNNEFAIIRENIKVITLNQWGYNYLRNSEKGLKLIVEKIEKKNLVKFDLKRNWNKKPNIAKLEQKKMYPFLHEIIEIFDILKSLGFKHTWKDTEIEKHINWINENGLDLYFNNAVIERIQKLELINPKQKDQLKKIKPFITFWKSSTIDLWETSKITLDDQKYWALELLTQKLNKTKKLPFFKGLSRYNHILVDEFQDINPLDLELISKLSIANDSTLTIVGDDDQAIFEWRGSSPNFILDPNKFFGRKFTTFILGLNYRSPQNIVHHSQNVIKHNTKREDKIVSSVNQNNAKITRFHYHSHIDSLNDIINLAKEVNLEKNKTLAILSRKRSQLIPLQILLTSENINFFAKEDLNVFLSEPFKDLKEILQLCEIKNIQKSQFEIIEDLLKLCNRSSKYELTKTERQQLSVFFANLIPQTDCLINVLTNLHKNRYSAPDIGFHNNLDDRVKLRLEYSKFIEVISSNSVSSAIDKIGENFSGLQRYFPMSDEGIFFTDPPFLYLSEYAKRYGNRFIDFLQHLESSIINMSKYLHIENDEVDTNFKIPIHLMTSLRAKGKEYDIVILLDVVDDIWPIKFADTDERKEQERRLFYVAITRPKSELRLITVDKILDKKYFLSPFIQEMGDWQEITKNVYEII